MPSSAVLIKHALYILLCERSAIHVAYMNLLIDPDLNREINSRLECASNCDPVRTAPAKRPMLRRVPNVPNRAHPLPGGGPRYSDDPHLRSKLLVSGYHIQASDGMV
jgi:hypothetical protein